MFCMSSAVRCSTPFTDTLSDGEQAGIVDAYSPMTSAHERGRNADANQMAAIRALRARRALRTIQVAHAHGRERRLVLTGSAIGHLTAGHSAISPAVRRGTTARTVRRAAGRRSGPRACARRAPRAKTPTRTRGSGLRSGCSMPPVSYTLYLASSIRSIVARSRCPFSR